MTCQTTPTCPECGAAREKISGVYDPYEVFFCGSVCYCNPVAVPESAFRQSDRCRIASLTRQLAERDEELRRVTADNAELLDFLNQLKALFRTCDNERLNRLEESRDEAEKWKGEGDWFGWNFHQGRAGGMNEASIIFYRMKRLIDEALSALEAKGET